MLDPLGWTDDALTIALLGASAAALLLVLLCAAFWVSKSRHRAAQRFERRNSIRNSIRSSRSFNSLASSSGFLDAAGARRKPFVAPKGAEKFNAGSVDSIEKSQLNSSAEDNRSFDIYEVNDDPNRFSYAQLDIPQPLHHHQPPPPPPMQSSKMPMKIGVHNAAAAAHPPSYQLTFENHGYRDNSTIYESQNASRAPSEYWDSASLGQQSTNTASVSVHQNGVVITREIQFNSDSNQYQICQPPPPPTTKNQVSYQPSGPNVDHRSHEPDYSRVRSHSEAAARDSYSSASVVSDSTLAMKRELDESLEDAASAITLPQQRSSASSNHNRHAGINRYAVFY